MRLFCGFSLAYEVRRNIELLLQHLRPQADISWTPSDNLHITTKFIGEYPDERLPQLRETIGALPPTGAFKLGIRGIGWFPNPHQPRVLFAGVDAPPALSELASSTDAALAALGVKLESRPYNPHLTLGRIKPPSDLANLRRAIAALPSSDFGVFNASRHLLYLSKTEPEGTRYSVLAEFPLT